LLGEDGARIFARGLGIEVKGGLGLPIEGLRKGLPTYSEAVNCLDRLSEVMYLSSDICTEKEGKSSYKFMTAVD